MKNDGLYNAVNILRDDFLRAVDTLRLDGAQAAQAARMLSDSICRGLGAQSSVRLEAENAVVEIIDKSSGALIRRYLELEFLETSNGIRLSGEDMSGRRAQIVYLSQSAIAKMNELRGDGADTPRCDEAHEH